MHRIGVLGASFNPPTKGHENVIEQAMVAFDEILLIPSLHHPFGKDQIALKHRLNMLKCMVSDIPVSDQSKIKIVDLESVMSALQIKPRSIYTYDLMRVIQTLYDIQEQAVELQFILGPDNAEPEIWQKFYRYEDIEKQWQIFIAREQVHVRSTAVRELIRSGQSLSLSDYISPNVLKYIKAHGLYQSSKTMAKKPSNADNQISTIVNVALFTIDDGQLKVLVDHQQLPVIPIIPTEDSDIDGLVARSLYQTFNIKPNFIEQAQTVGAPLGQDHWEISVLYFGLLSEHDFNANQQVRWISCETLSQEIAQPFIDRVLLCLNRLQNKSLYTSLPTYLVNEAFTLTDLQRAFEIVLGFKMEKKSFRRRWLDADLLETTGESRRANHRPAQIYRLKSLQPYIFPRIIEGARETLPHD